MMQRLLFLSFAALICQSALAEITIESERAREASGPMSAAYMKITSSTNDRLTAAHCNCSKMTELHISTIEDSVMKMRPLEDGIKLPANELVELKPGGMHVMFMQLNEPLEAGSSVEVTLEFKKADSQTISIPVIAN